MAGWCSARAAPGFFFSPSRQPPPLREIRADAILQTHIQVFRGLFLKVPFQSGDHFFCFRFLFPREPLSHLIHGYFFERKSFDLPSETRLRKKKKKQSKRPKNKRYGYILNHNIPGYILIIIKKIHNNNNNKKTRQRRKGRSC